MKRTAIVLGSSRKNGYTSLLANEVASKSNAKVFNLTDYNINQFDYDFNNQDDDFKSLMSSILEHDNIVFATPIYWYSMSTPMKLFWDRMADLLMIEKDMGRMLKQRDAFVVSTGNAEEPKPCFEDAFKNSFEYLSMNYNGMLYVNTDFSESSNGTELKLDFKKFSNKITKFVDSLN